MIMEAVTLLLKGHPDQVTGDLVATIRWLGSCVREARERLL